MAIQLASPGAYDLSIHGPNGFFRHFAGSPVTVVQVEASSLHNTGELRLQLTDRSGRPGLDSHQHRPPLVIDVADAYGNNRQFDLVGTGWITIPTSHFGGWYDIALTTHSDASFSYQLAGRLESGDRLTSDPQLGLP